MGDEGVRGARRPGDEAASQEGITCEEVLAPRNETKATNARATWEEAGVDARAGACGVSGTSSRGRETTIHEARDVAFEGGGKSSRQRAVFRMVQNPAGTVAKARRSPAKRGQPKLSNGGEGRGNRGDASVPVHVGDAIRD